MIPKVIYICHKNLDFIKHYSKNWKFLNPEYEIKLYDNHLCYEFLKNEFSQLYCDIFNYIKDGPIKADFWRICVIYKYGGLYVDADIEPLVPLREYLEKDIDFVSCIDYHNNNSFNPHFILANKDDIFLKKCIDKYVEFYNNKKPYSYWGWSITDVFKQVFESIINRKRLSCGIHTIENRKYQFILEIFPNHNLNSVYCVYNNVRVLNNRYKFYDPSRHNFTKIIPGGSWIKQCRSYEINDKILKAVLIKTNKSVNSTSVVICENVNYCNNNGEFCIENCIDKDILPNGNWIYSATTYKIENGILYANLVNINGSIISSNIKIYKDSKYINNDGILKLDTHNLSFYEEDPGYIPKYLNKRNDILIDNEYSLIQNSEKFQEFHCVIYYLSENKIKVIIRLLDSELYNCDQDIELVIYSIDKLKKECINISKFLNNTYINEFITEINIFPKNNYEQKIPKIIVQTEETNNILNVSQYNSIISLLELNPEYEYYFFDEYDRREFIKLNFPEYVLNSYDNSIDESYKKNIFIYCFLYLRGGCYINLKINMYDELKNIINKEDTYFMVNNKFSNLLFSIIPKSELLLEVINRYCNSIEINNLLNEFFKHESDLYFDDLDNYIYIKKNKYKKILKGNIC